jgi:hypothetical protein
MRHFDWRLCDNRLLAGMAPTPGPLPADSDCPAVRKSLTCLPKIPTAKQLFPIKMLAVQPVRPFGQGNFTPCRLSDTEVDEGRIDPDRGSKAEAIAPR